MGGASHWWQMEAASDLTFVCVCVCVGPKGAMC